MNKILRNILIAMLSFSVVFGIITRFSYSNDAADSDKRDESVAHVRGEAGGKELLEISYEELSESDIIIKAVPVGDFVCEKQATRCKLKVLEVYKGDITPGEEINFYMSGFFSDNYKKKYGRLLFMGHSPFNFMLPGKEYYVFALKGHNGKMYEEVVGKTYVYANVEYSYFLTEMTEPEILDEDKEYKFKDIKNNEFNCYSVKDRDKINKFKQKLINDFIKSDK